VSSPHPFGSWPYNPRSDVAPGYVGASWAAPAPYRPLPPRQRKRSGAGCCVGAAIVVLGGIGVIGTALIIAAIAAGTPSGPEPPAPVPTSEPPVPAPEPPSPKRTEPEPEAWVTGVCRDVSRERNKSSYDATRGNGSARRLRGKVVVLHIRLDARKATWTHEGEHRVEQAALLQQRFYTQNARRYRVDDLTLEVIPWALKTPADLPSLEPRPDGRLDERAAEQLRDGSKRAIETALGEHLEQTVARMHREGYDEVGMIVYLPVTTSAREFAWSALRPTPSSYPEVAYMFSPLRNFGDFAVTVSHEGLHLFGADDLYRMRTADPGDAHDVMGEACTGFRQATIGDATAYAIGWLSTAPKRPYAIVDR